MVLKLHKHLKYLTNEVQTFIPSGQEKNTDKIIFNTKTQYMAHINRFSSRSFLNMQKTNISLRSNLTPFIKKLHFFNQHSHYFFLNLHNQLGCITSNLFHLTASVLTSLQTFTCTGPLIQFSLILTAKRLLQKTQLVLKLEWAISAHTQQTFLCYWICKSILEGKKVSELQYLQMHR